jgi:hypothetical protein
VTYISWRGEASILLCDECFGPGFGEVSSKYNFQTKMFNVVPKTYIFNEDFLLNFLTVSITLFK